MAVNNLLVRLITMFGKGELSKTLAQYDPPSRGDILHDGLVGAGKTWGGILGTAAGITGGEAVGGPYGATAGALALAPAGTLAGGWAAHGAYLQGLLINDILTHPENWTVDAAGAIIPAPPKSANDPPRQNASRSSAFESGAPPLHYSPAPNARAYGIPVPSSGVLGTDPTKPVSHAAAPRDLADRFGHWSGVLGPASASHAFLQGGYDTPSPSAASGPALNGPKETIVDAPAVRRSDNRRLTRRDVSNEADVFTSGASPVPYLPYR
ncbi:hypothetical protein [Bradyrhizobium ottawaense]|uniref:hypothetical protein n=1 Tax=Bradyrhizobium ottawaense TaxID=931866 RepID=UPI0030F38857